MATPFDDGWVPAQVKTPGVLDFRQVSYGPRGFKAKNKRKMEELDTEADAMVEDSSGVNVPLVRDVKKVKLNIEGVGKVSQRCWKPPAERAGSLRNPALSTSWEKKMKDREERKMFKEEMDRIKEARDEKLKALREQRQKAEERKAENKKKSAVVQKISNSQTVKRMMKSKKQRKKLLMADTN